MPVSATPATSAGCCPRSPSTHRRPTSAARERPRAAPPAPAPPVAPATDDVIAALDALREEVECCSSCVLARDAHQGRVRRGRPRRRPHVRRRGARLPRGPAGPAVRRPGRQAARAAARVHRHDARAGLHRQRPQEPPAQQPRPAPGGDRRLPAVPVAADRDHPAQGHLHAGQLRDQAAERRPDAASPRCTGSRGRPRSPGTGCTCIRSSIRPRRCTRRPMLATLKEDFLRLPRAAGARRAAAGRGGGRAAGRGAAGLAAARAPAPAGGRAGAGAGRRAGSTLARRRPRRPSASGAAVAPTRRPSPRRRRRTRRRVAAEPAPTDAGAADRAAAGDPRRRRPRRRARPLPRPARPPNRSSSASSR